MNRPNIFKYAQTELSQDAMICWLLECYHSEDKTYRRIGLDFIKFILEDNTLTLRDDDDVELEKESPHRQYYHMDVYANIRVNKKVYPIIFEDKTNTYLHGSQHERYVCMVKDWKTNEKWEDWRNGLFTEKDLEWKKTIFVFFKTGYIFNWQRKELEQISKTLENDDDVLRQIELKDIEKFMQGQRDKDNLLSDYYEYLKEKLDTSRKERLVSEINKTGKPMPESMFDNIFCEIFDTAKKFDHSYQGWAAANFVKIADKGRKSENNIYYVLRIDKRKNGDSRDYAVIMQQCRNENYTSGNEEEREKLINERRKNAAYAREICQDIFKELNIENIEIEVNDADAMPEQNNIFKVFLDDDGNVIDFFRDFIRKFVDKFTDKIGGTICEKL